MLINIKSFKKFYNFNISLENTYRELIPKFNIFFNIIKAHTKKTKKKIIIKIV